MKRRELDILYIATRVVLLFWLPLYISDLGLYQEYARKVIPGHQIPYANFDIEYPPLAFVLMALPTWIHDWLNLKGDDTYRICFGLFLLPLDFLMYRAFRRRPSFPGAPFAYILLSCAMGLLIFDRLDLAVGFLIAWPFLAPGKLSDARCAWCWGLGGALKLVPLALTPARVFSWPGTWREKSGRFARFALGAAAPLGICCVAIAWATSGKLAFFSRHADRGVQIESLVGSVMMFLHVFTRFAATKVEWNFGGQHLAPLPGLVLASRVVFYGGLACTYGLLALPRFRRDTLVGAWLAMLAVVTFGYVLSPQFLLWLVPLGICAAGRVSPGGRREVWLAIFGVAVAITGMHFRFYWDYVNLHQFAVCFLLARNLCLVALWGLSFCWMGRAKKLEALPSDL